MTTAAVLYPHAWNVWRVALSGPYKSDPGAQALHLDTLSRVNAWLEHWVHDLGPGDSVRIQDTTPNAKVIARREELPSIPMLPAGDYHEVTVYWFYDGEQKAIGWPADDDAMLMTIYDADRSLTAPENWLQKRTDWLKEQAKAGQGWAEDELKKIADAAAAGINKVQTLALVLGGTALLIALAVYVASKARKPAGYVLVAPDQEPTQ
jgi:hypothetical protein